TLSSTHYRSHIQDNLCNLCNLWMMVTWSPSHQVTGGPRSRSTGAGVVGVVCCTFMRGHDHGRCRTRLPLLRQQNLRLGMWNTLALPANHFYNGPIPLHSSKSPSA